MGNQGIHPSIYPSVCLLISLLVGLGGWDLQQTNLALDLETESSSLAELSSHPSSRPRASSKNARDDETQWLRTPLPPFPISSGLCPL